MDLKGPIGRLVIDHPSARNAISPVMMLELESAVKAIEAWPGSLLCISGQGPNAFCAGSDLSAVRRALDRPDLAQAMLVFMGQVCARLRAIPQLSIACVQGAAVGGGAELMTCADLRIIQQDARVQFVHARLGLTPGWGGAARLRAIVGYSEALTILARARPLNLEAHPGLWHSLALDAKQATEELLEELSKLPVPSIRGAKEALQSPQREQESFLSLWGGDQQRQALAKLSQGKGH
ncbi:MAG: enoyl-CoA hydratase/carnithine racemase [Cognaticolwellia sp.]